VIIKLDRMLWAPVPDTAVTAEEFAAARALFQEIHGSMWWNPWMMTDRAAELHAMGQWTRVEPSLGRKTPEEYTAEFERQIAEDEARALAELGQVERDRTRRAASMTRSGRRRSPM
jgi:hypothetical protein